MFILMRESEHRQVQTEDTKQNITKQNKLERSTFRVNCIISGPFLDRRRGKTVQRLEGKTTNENHEVKPGKPKAVVFGLVFRMVSDRVSETMVFWVAGQSPLE
jgi:hypothetical protein